MAQTLTPTRRSPDLDNLMKVVFRGPLFDQTVHDTEFMKYVQEGDGVKIDSTTAGRYVEKSAQTRLGGGAGSRGDVDYLPEARRSKYKTSRINLRKLMVTCELTGDAMRLARTDEAAFVDAMEHELVNASARGTDLMDKQYIGTGAGIRARVASINAGAGTITVDRPFGVTGYSKAWLQFLEGDSLVFTSDAAGTTIRNAAGVRFALVGDITESTGTLKLESADGTAPDAALMAALVVNDYIFNGDSAGISAPTATDNREIDGVIAAVDDGSIVPVYHNRTRSGDRLSQGIVVAAGGVPLTEDLLITSMEDGKQRGNADPDRAVMSFGGSRGYWRDVKGDRRFNDARGSYTAGKGDLQITIGSKVLDLTTARKLPPELCFLLTMKTFERYTPGAGEWDDATGAIWNRVTDSTGRLDQFYAVYLMYENLHCNAPRQNIRIDGLDPTQ